MGSVDTCAGAGDHTSDGTLVRSRRTAAPVRFSPSDDVVGRLRESPKIDDVMRQLTPAECVVLLLQDLRPELIDVSCKTLVEQGQRLAAMLWRDVERRDVPTRCDTKADRK